MKWFQRRQKAYERRGRTRLKFKKFLRTEKVCHQIAKSLIDDSPRALVAIGSTRTPANSPIKGYIRTPNPQLLRALQTRADVVEIGEFRTTLLCSHCRGTYRKTVRLCVSNIFLIILFGFSQHLLIQNRHPIASRFAQTVEPYGTVT